MKIKGMESVSPSSRIPSRKVNVEKLALLCQDIEAATRLITDKDSANSMLVEARERSSSQAQYANLLFRNYHQTVWKKFGHRTNEDEDINSDFFLRITSGCSVIGLEGTEDILHGESARESFIARLRCVVGLLSGISFIVFVSLKRFNKQRLEASDFFRDDRQECKLLADSVNGSFDMTLYHLVASGCFFMCFSSAVLIFYYFQPVDGAGRKFVPGLSALINGERAPEWSNYARRGADWLHRHSKLIEVCTDGLLLVYSLFFGVSASIALDSGNRFTFSDSAAGATHTHTVSVQYYTISTIYSTFSHNTLCVEGPDPAASLRAGMSLCYLALFALALCFRVSYSAYRKVSLRRERDTSLSLTGVGDGRSPLLHSHHHPGMMVAGSERGSFYKFGELEEGERGEGDGDDHDGVSLGLAGRMGMGVDGDVNGSGSDSELDVVLDSTQSQLSSHGADYDYSAAEGRGRGRTASDSSSEDGFGYGYDGRAPFAA